MNGVRSGSLPSLVMAPVLWWNAQHEWVTFAFQIDHGLGTLPHRSATATLRRLGDLLAIERAALQGRSDLSSDAKTAAPWIALARVLTNLDEFITRE